MTKLSRAPISSRVVSIADLRSLARRRLPKAVFDYLDGGAEGEVTLRENCRVFEDVTFRPRQAVTVPGCEMRTRFLGLELSFPALLAPVGYSRLNAGRKTHLPQQTKRQARPGSFIEMMAGYIREDCHALQ
jgi:isopentenyl diphosphate isomerase/L-lactate dehydrogenase-like FMN-dependent dehydrogenase